MRLKTWLRNFDRYRRRHMQGLEPVLYRVLADKSKNEMKLIPQNEVRSIVIVRNNKRMGNILFLLPFVKQVRANYPNAKITLLLSQPWQGSIFENLGIDEITYSYFSFSKSVQFFKSINKLKSQSIDLILTPFSSVEDAFITSMLPARNKVSFQHVNRTDCFTHVFDKAHDKHMAYNPLPLISHLAVVNQEQGCHKLALSYSERMLGKQARLSIYSGEKKLVAFFRGARGKKKLSDPQWSDILKRFEEESKEPIQWLEILSEDVSQPLRSDLMTYRNSNLRELASFLKYTDAFISCDTGPLHLADASGTYCIGLFTHTNPDVYGVINGRSLNLYDWYQSDDVTPTLNNAC